MPVFFIVTQERRMRNMLNHYAPSKSFINQDVYRDKVLGCWTGKNIGGTLGAPMEGQREIFDISFYTQDLQGNPAPNDDLDLQLVWLKAIEENGIFNINERVLGEYWLGYITGPWNEYGVGKFNMRNGLLPPLSGYCNNDQWKNSNGAWIRSEIWACLFPGEPDEVAPYAWYDSCVDHADDGIYAEVFTAVLESAAFIENDLRKLIDYGFARIPADCRVARSVKIVLDCYDNGEDWKTARNKVVEDSADLGWFQAPANVAFVIIGLLYGEGDFGKSICIAVNCGDDTDCTGATCGAILGIMKGRSGIPQEWIEPIGETIVTISFTTLRIEPPRTLSELTDRVIACKKIMDQEDPTLLRLTDGETVIEDEMVRRLSDGDTALYRLTHRSSCTLEFPLPFGMLSVNYGTSPVTKPGDTQEITLMFEQSRHENSVVQMEWQLPEGWSFAEGPVHQIMGYYDSRISLKVHLTAGDFASSMVHIPVIITLSERNYPTYITVPFQREGTVEANWKDFAIRYFDRRCRILQRTK